MDILLKNGYVVTPVENGFKVEKKDIYVKGGKITNKVIKTPHKILDLQGRVVLPGLINAHHHFYSMLSKGIPAKGPFVNFTGTLEKLWWKLDRVLNKDDVVVSTVLNLRECIKAGVTTVFDHHISVPYIKNSLTSMGDVFEKYNINGVLCFETSDRNGKEIFEQSLDENINFYEKSKKSKLLKGTIGMHASFTLSEESMKIIKDKAKDAPIHIHTAEDGADVETTQKISKLRVIERLEKYNLLNKNSLIVHGNVLNEKELDILSKKDIFVVHNPDSNMNNALKIKNISETLAKNIKLTVGTDGMTSNMLKSYKNAFVLNKYIAQNPDIGFSEMNSVLLNAFKMKTAYGFDLGLNENDTADLIVTDYQPYTVFNSDNFLGHFIFGITEARVQYVLKGDNFLMDNFNLTIDEEADFCEKQIEKSNKLFERFTKI